MNSEMEFQIAKLELQHGDILVIKGNTPPHSTFDFSDILPSGVRVLYIPADVELSVLTQADIESRAA